MVALLLFLRLTFILPFGETKVFKSFGLGSKSTKKIKKSIGINTRCYFKIIFLKYLEQIALADEMDQRNTGSNQVSSYSSRHSYCSDFLLHLFAETDRQTKTQIISQMLSYFFFKKIFINTGASSRKSVSFLDPSSPPPFPSMIPSDTAVRIVQGFPKQNSPTFGVFSN